MRLVFDTETSGLLKPGLAADHPSQPAMCQLGAAVFDGAWKKVGLFVSLIKPDGWSIEPQAEAHHGISDARCAKFGVPLPVALAALQGFADTAKQIVAHHAEFDRHVVEISLCRVGSNGMWWRKRAPQFACTMELSTGPCGLPGQYGTNKFPTLEEASARFLGDGWRSRHDAEDDLMQTARIAQALEREGLLPLPSLRPPVINPDWRKS